MSDRDGVVSDRGDEVEGAEEEGRSGATVPKLLFLFSHGHTHTTHP